MPKKVFVTRYKKSIAAALAVFALTINSPASTSQGGASLYLPGTYNDFSAGVFGPSGVYFRDDFVPHHGTISRADWWPIL